LTADFDSDAGEMPDFINLDISFATADADVVPAILLSEGFAFSVRECGVACKGALSGAPVADCATVSFLACTSSVDTVAELTFRLATDFIVFVSDFIVFVSDFIVFVSDFIVFVSDWFTATALLSPPAFVSPFGDTAAGLEGRFLMAMSPCEGYIPVPRRGAMMAIVRQVAMAVPIVQRVGAGASHCAKRCRRVGRE
jgi:hypothetical protein